jgi:tetratricopeptide (TPR) repeat protein
MFSDIKCTSLPVKFVLGWYFFILLYLLLSCQEQSVRKIKLASLDSATASIENINAQTIKVSDLQQQNIAVLEFRNETGDVSANWLQRGISQMLITQLSQSSYLNVIPMNRISEVGDKIRQEHLHLDDRGLAFMIGRAVLAEIIITGRFYKEGESIKINVLVLDVPAERVMNEETASGRQLEAIFSMIDEISDKLFKQLRLQKSEAIAVSQMTQSPEAFRCYSRALVNIEKFLHQEAEKCLEDALAEDSTFASALLKMAEIKKDLGKREASNYYLHLAQKYQEKLSESDKYALKVLDAQVNEKYDDLLPILEEGVAKIPGDINLRLDLARTYNAAGRQDRALEQYNIVQDLDPLNKMVYNDLGYLYARRGDFETGLKYIDKYMELAPDEPNPYDSKGEILMMAGRLDAAIEQLQMALQKWPNFFHSANRLSELYAEYGIYDQALKFLETARRNMGKSDWMQYYYARKGQYLWKANRLSEAENVFKQVLVRNKMDPIILFHLCDFYRSLGDTVKLVQIQEQMLHQLSINAKQYEVDDRLMHYILQSDLSPARHIPVMTKLLENESSDFNKLRAQFVLALLYARSGNCDAAQKIVAVLKEQLYALVLKNRFLSWGEVWQYYNEFVACLPSREDKMGAPIVELAELAEGAHLDAYKIAAHLAFTSSARSSKQLPQVEKEYLSFGFPLEDKWSFAGPYEARDHSGFNFAYPPEVQKEEQLQWLPNKDNFKDGYINIKSTLGDHKWSVVYGLIYIHSPDERQVRIRIGCDEGYKLWLNGDLIWQQYVRQGAIIDNDIITVVLHQGFNRLLMKVLNFSYDWGYYLRVTDDAGNGMRDISFQTPDEVHATMARQ